MGLYCEHLLIYNFSLTKLICWQLSQQLEPLQNLPKDLEWRTATLSNPFFGNQPDCPHGTLAALDTFTITLRTLQQLQGTSTTTVAAVRDRTPASGGLTWVKTSPDNLSQLWKAALQARQASVTVMQNLWLVETGNCAVIGANPIL
jgi:hypothetical protein